MSLSEDGIGGGIIKGVDMGSRTGFFNPVKSITKAVKGVAKGVKDVVKSDIGKAALLAAGAYYAPAMFGGTVGFGPASTYGSFARGLMSPGLIGPMTKAGSLGRGISSALTGGGLGKTLGVFAAGSLLPSVLGQAQETGEAEVLTRDVGALRTKLTQAYKLQRTFSDAPDEDAAIAAQVEADLSEYTSGAGGYANGGRIGFQQGGNFDFNKFLQDRTKEALQVEGIGQAIRPVVESNVRAQAARDLSQAARGGGIESFLKGQLGSGIIPGMSAIQSPMSGTSAFGRQQVLDALTKAYMKPYSMPTGSAYDQMRFAQPGQSGSFVEMQGGQFGDGMGIVIDGKRYATEQEAIDDVGIERYNMFYAKGGRVGFAYGSLPKGIQKLYKAINKKFGKGTIKTADEMERPQSAKDKEMFEDFEKRTGPKRQLTDEEIEMYEEELGDSETWMSEGTVEEAEQALKRQKEYQQDMFTQYKAGKLNPQPGEKGRKEFLEGKLQEMQMSGDKKLMTTDEIEELSTFDLGEELDQLRGMAPKMAERFELQKKYPGIDDNLLTQIIDDPDPQRKAEVLATIDQAFELMRQGKSQEEVYDIMKQMTDRTKQASGGLAYLMGL